MFNFLLLPVLLTSAFLASSPFADAQIPSKDSANSSGGSPQQQLAAVPSVLNNAPLAPNVESEESGGKGQMEAEEEREQRNGKERRGQNGKEGRGEDELLLAERVGQGSGQDGGRSLMDRAKQNLAGRGKEAEKKKNPEENRSREEEEEEEENIIEEGQRGGREEKRKQVEGGGPLIVRVAGGRVRLDREEPEVEEEEDEGQEQGQKRCQDRAENCADNSAFCTVKIYQRLMAENCARTCRLCGLKVPPGLKFPEDEKGAWKEEEGGETEGKRRRKEAEGKGREEEEGGAEKRRDEHGREAEKRRDEHGREAEKRRDEHGAGRGGGGRGRGRSPAKSECRDLSARCQFWAQRGFCASPLFHPQLKLRFCARSCGLCDAEQTPLELAEEK